jgi:predicted MFS family arabinose efflux permease
MVLWKDDFKWSYEQLSLLMAIVHVANGLTTPISGHIADLVPASVSVGGGIAFLSMCYGLVSLITQSWQLWFIYGVLCGCAFGFLNLNVFSVVVRRALPPKSRGLGVGIATSGSTAGQLSFVPLFAFMAKKYSWRACYVALSVSSAALVLPAIYLLRTKIGTGNQLAKRNDNEISPAHRSRSFQEKMIIILSSKSMWLLTVSFVLCGITTTGFIESQIVALAIDRGFSLVRAATIFTIISAINGIGMVMAGWLTDRANRSLLLCCIFVIRGLAFLLLFYGFSEEAMYGFAVLFGWVDYSVVPPVVSLVETLAGEDCVGLGMGILLMWHSLGAAAGSSLGGALYNPMAGKRSYSKAIIVCFFGCFLAAICSYLIRSPEPIWSEPVEEKKKETRDDSASEIANKMMIIDDGFCSERTPHLFNNRSELGDNI